MLVEKRISSKINYDVLKDLADGFGSSASEINNITNSTSQPAPQEDVKDGVLPPITRTPVVARGRLPSLSARKRTFSTLEASPSLESKYGAIWLLVRSYDLCVVLIGRQGYKAPR